MILRGRRKKKFFLHKSFVGWNSSGRSDLKKFGFFFSFSRAFWNQTCTTRFFLILLLMIYLLTFFVMDLIQLNILTLNNLVVKVKLLFDFVFDYLHSMFYDFHHLNQYFHLLPFHSMNLIHTMMIHLLYEFHLMVLFLLLVLEKLKYLELNFLPDSI